MLYMDIVMKIVKLFDETHMYKLLIYPSLTYNLICAYGKWMKKCLRHGFDVLTSSTLCDFKTIQKFASMLNPIFQLSCLHNFKKQYQYVTKQQKIYLTNLWLVLLKQYFKYMCFVLFSCNSKYST